jgi:hypothetical protein
MLKLYESFTLIVDKKSKDKNILEDFEYSDVITLAKNVIFHISLKNNEIIICF